MQLRVDVSRYNLAYIRELAFGHPDAHTAWILLSVQFQVNQVQFTFGNCVLVGITSAQQGRHMAYKLPQGIRYESMQSINLVGTRC